MTQPILNPVRFLPCPLLPAEARFARCLREGESCKVGDGKLPDPEKPVESGDTANVVRGEIIRFFAYGGSMENPVLGRVIHLQGALVCGEPLDLTHADIPYALFFENCRFASSVDMQHAECVALYLDGSHLAKGLKADGLTTKGNVPLRGGFSAEGGVRLLGANIGRNLSCMDGKFCNPRGYALDADQLTTKGSVLMGGHFSAKGGVRLLGANIGGNLDCVGGKFRNSNGYAFVADQLTVKDNMLMSGGFSAEGEVLFFSAEGGVRLLGASIGGNLDCGGGKFRNPEGYALNAEHVKTGGHVYLNRHGFAGKKEPFAACGRVRFTNADIGGNFNCKGGQFLHSGKGSALAAGGLKSRGAVFLSEGFTARGEVALHVARIGNFVCAGCKPNDKSPTVINLSSTKAVAVDDDEQSWEPFQFLLDDFTYDAFFGANTPKDESRRRWLAKRPKEMPSKDGEPVKVLFSPLPYEQAAKVMFGMGHARDAREVLLEKERLQTKDPRTPWHPKIGRRLWDEFAGYGYRLRRTVAWSLAVVAVGWGVFSHTSDIGGIVPHQPAILASDKYQSAVDKETTPMKAALDEFPEHPEFNPIVFSADVFIPLFALHQEPFWYPVAGSENAVAWLSESLWTFGLAIGVAVLALSPARGVSGVIVPVAVVGPRGRMGDSLGVPRLFCGRWSCCVFTRWGWSRQNTGTGWKSASAGF